MLVITSTAVRYMYTCMYNYVHSILAFLYLFSFNQCNINYKNENSINIIKQILRQITYGNEKLVSNKICNLTDAMKKAHKRKILLKQYFSHVHMQF